MRIIAHLQNSGMENFRYGKYKCRRGPRWWTSVHPGDLHLYIKMLNLQRGEQVILQVY